MSDTGSNSTSSELARRLKLGKQVGAGSFAFVCKAMLDGQPVAAKILRPEVARRPKALKVFLREAQVMRKHKHK